MMATAIRDGAPVAKPDGDEDRVRRREDAAGRDELPFNFFIGPNIPLPGSNGYLPA
jgi:hypothetical protein